MVTHISKKVVCIKDIPSNLIEEAIFILKTNVSNTTINESTKSKNENIILEEAENIINNYVDEHQKKRAMRQQETRIRQKKIIEISSIVIACIFAFVCLLIAKN